ncbi:hypothetical protein N7481_010573 [Penicillium waksmanii]|uniref:uncharacterized protein n=1 Tax=Penicillium waksmanii TaxID=69791 RepID=UPI0025484049|nr:uncharacterized protein N7481_010573 [Penicillium waksmanii]KAJ5973363.1 hypothetical protein N7481_010573 [Penicillium waksmanii]
MRFFVFSVLCTLLLLGTLTSAWSWDNVAVARDSLNKRADQTTETSATETTSSTTASDTTSATKTGKDEKTTDSGTTDTNTDTTTDSKSNTKTKSKSDKTTATTSISINPAAGAGGISMITPGSTSTTYFRIGENATFVWNYTSLSVTPSHVNVVASCSLNSATYTLTHNMTVKETGKVVWDTNATQTVPLLSATYTLFVVDSEKDLDDTASAGHLSSNIGYSFGMYLSQPYTPLNQFKCATCSGALSDVQRQGLKFAVGMAAITVVSFTWFVGGLGLFN